ncbi:MAG: hypothetical protein KJO69_02145, partial [Gammaproteobacteria bacterium]|nr:hypothetical protein [Gammaproteobacteria bacterium]
IYPMPFNSAKHSANGERIVLLDPVSDLTRDLFELQTAGEDIATLFSSGAIQISNNILTRSAPKGVDVVAFDWK